MWELERSDRMYDETAYLLCIGYIDWKAADNYSELHSVNMSCRVVTNPQGAYIHVYKCSTVN